MLGMACCGWGPVHGPLEIVSHSALASGVGTAHHGPIHNRTVVFPLLVSVDHGFSDIGGYKSSEDPEKCRF